MLDRKFNLEQSLSRCMVCQGHLQAKAKLMWSIDIILINFHNKMHYFWKTSLESRSWWNFGANISATKFRGRMWRCINTIYEIRIRNPKNGNTNKAFSYLGRFELILFRRAKSCHWRHFRRGSQWFGKEWTICLIVLAISLKNIKVEYF